jgi:NTP pyrophosphatase (non-canonical NTP hydrolase)
MDYPCHEKTKEFWCDKDGPCGFMGHTCVPERMHELRALVKTHLGWGPLHGPDKVRFMALALCGETGELANLIKKDWRGDGGDRRDQIGAELADVGNYLFMLAEALGVDLPAAMLNKLIEVEKRPDWKARLP